MRGYNPFKRKQRFLTWPAVLMHTKTIKCWYCNGKCCKACNSKGTIEVNVYKPGPDPAEILSIQTAALYNLMGHARMEKIKPEGDRP